MNNLYQYPPNCKDAIDFRLATKFGFVKPEDIHFDVEPFSGYSLRNSAYPCKQSTATYSENGVGYSIYFKFIKLLIQVQILLILIYTGPTLIVDMLGESCIDERELSDEDLQNYMTAYCINIANDDVTNVYDNICESYYKYNCNVLPMPNKCHKAFTKLYFETNPDIICYAEFYNVLSFANRIKNNTYTTFSETLFCSILFVGFFVSVYIWRRRIRTYKSDFLKSHHFISNYSVEVSGLPSNYLNTSNNQKKLLNLFLNELMHKAIEAVQGENDKLEFMPLLHDHSYVHHITYVHSCQKYLLLKEELKKKIIEKFHSNDEQTKLIIQTRINEIENILEKIKTDYKNDMFNENIPFLGIVFITFNSNFHKKLFLKSYKTGFVQKSLFRIGFHLRVRFLNHNLKIKEPTQILWANLEPNKIKKILTRVFIEIVLTLMLVGAFILVLKVNVYKFTLKNQEVFINLAQYVKTTDKTEYILKLLTVLIIILILAINSIIAISLKMFAKMEMYTCVANMQTLTGLRLGRRQFINSCLSVLSVSLILGTYFDAIGLTASMTGVFMINSIAKPIMEMIGLNFHIKNFKWWYTKRKSPSNIFLVQEDLNKASAYPDFEFSIKMADALKMSLTSFFYAPMMPLASIFNLIGLILSFHAHKINLIYYSSKKIRYGPKIINACLNEVYKLPFIFVIGMLVMDFIIDQVNGVPFYPRELTLILLPISVLIMISGFLIKFKKLDANTDILPPYVQIEKLVPSTYDSACPLTQINALFIDSLTPTDFK